MACVQRSQTKDQDPLSTIKPDLIPVVGVDIWEHAFYIQVQSISRLKLSDGNADLLLFALAVQGMGRLMAALLPRLEP